MSLFQRKPKSRDGHGLFGDLPLDQQWRAHQWLNVFLQRHPHYPAHLYPILMGQARRLAKQTPEQLSKWGRQMHAKRGGYAVQRRYQAEGRHPTAYATLTRVNKQKAKRRAEEQAQERKRLGLPPPPRIVTWPTG
jgi:hypothetical protein